MGPDFISLIRCTARSEIYLIADPQSHKDTHLPPIPNFPEIASSATILLWGFGGVSLIRWLDDFGVLNWFYRSPPIACAVSGCISVPLFASVFS